MAGPPVMFRFVAADRVQWWEPGLAVNEGDLNGLAGAAWERRLLLVVPGEFCLLSRVQLPVKQRRAFMQALPYALEEHLAGEVESLHFAAGELHEGGAPVAVLNREVLSSWLERCAATRLQVSQAVPDPLLLPWSAGDWSLLVESDRAVVRTGEYDGFACERDTLPLLLELSLAQTSERPVRLRVWGDAPALSDDLPVLQEGPGRVSILGTAPVGLNLLQGPFSRTAGVQKWLRPWRGAAILAGLAVVLQLSGLLIERWQLAQERDSLRVTQMQIFQQAMPAVSRIVNPRVQLQNRLNELAGGEQGTDFMSLLEKTAEVLIQVPTLRLEGLRFQNGRLELELEGTDLNRFDQLRELLQQRAELRVEVRTTRREDSAVSRVSVQARGGN